MEKEKTGGKKVAINRSSGKRKKEGSEN